MSYEALQTAGKSTFYVPSPNKNGGYPASPCKRAAVGCIGAQIFPEEKGSTTPRWTEAAKKAEKVSEKEFAELATRHKYSKIPWEWKAKGVKSLPEARTKMLNYGPLKSLPKLPSLSGAAGAIGGALWVGGMVHAFTTDSTSLDRAAAMTAIIPFVGCGVHTAAAVENKENTAVVGIDSALCLIGDTLILSGFFPIGLLVHLARFIVQLFAPPKPPTRQEALQARDNLWTKFLHDHVYRYIYSHIYHSPQQDFAFKLNNTLAVIACDVLSEAAQVIGALNASSEASESDAEMDLARRKTIAQEAIER
ncbi:Heat-labile enterotoxin, A chain [Metarhizium brunneum]